MEREEENEDIEDIYKKKQKSPSESNEETRTKVANTFNYKQIEDKMDILNTKRNNTYVNVNVIDKHIQEIDNLHHNVDNNLGPGVQLYQLPNTTEDRQLAVTNERYYSENVYRSSTNIKGKMITHSELLLTANSKDVPDSQGTCRYFTHNDEIIGNVGKSRTKEKIRKDNKISITTSKESNRINSEIVNSTSNGENDTEEYKKKCEEQRRESFACCNDEGNESKPENEKRGSIASKSDSLLSTNVEIKNIFKNT